MLRRDRDDDGDAAGDDRSGRRGDRLRAVLRELRARRDRLGRDAALRPAARARLGFDPDELAAAFSNRTRAIIINTPNNPTGKVFSREELGVIARLCQQWDVLAVTDEIYEHIVYDGHQHVPLATLDGMAERTVTINGLSKTFSVTGWRIGWAIAPPALSGAIRKMHDFITVGAPAPLQEAGAAALALDDSYYQHLAADYAASARPAARHPRAARLRDVSVRPARTTS